MALQAEKIRCEKTKTPVSASVEGGASDFSTRPTTRPSSPSASSQTPVVRATSRPTRSTSSVASAPSPARWRSTTRPRSASAKTLSQL